MHSLSTTCIWQRAFSTFLIVLILSACTPTQQVGSDAILGDQSELTVLAAASLTETFAEITQGFNELYPGVEVNISYAGSQQLAQQLIQGAQADIFASANLDQMDNVISAGRVAPTAPQVFAFNQLIVVTPADGPRPIRSLQELVEPDLKIILAADEVPVGAYTLEFLDKAATSSAFGPEYKEKVLNNVVSLEANVKAVINKVALGEADAGVVYASDVTPTNREKLNVLEIPPELNVLASYRITPLLDTANNHQVAQFISFVLSPEGQEILAASGLIPLNAISQLP